MTLIRRICIVLLLFSGFLSAQPQEAPVLEAIDRNVYILAPGDILSVVVDGGCSEIMLASGVLSQSFCTVSGDGYISISGIGAIEVGELSISEAQSNVQAKAEQYYPAVRINISLYSPRYLNVSIRGMAEEPGTYLLSATERVSDLITAAGGISAYGSRTGFMYDTHGNAFPFDLHCSVETGSYISDPFLTEAVSVVIDECTNPVFVMRTGFNRRAAEIEISNTIHSIETWDSNPQVGISEFFDRMGGVAGNVNLSNSGIARNNDFLPIWDDSIGLLDDIVLPGDTIVLVSYRDSVFVGGAVEIPTAVSFRPEMSVLDYVIAAGGYDSGAATGEIKLIRNGVVYASGTSILGMTLLPGDAIEVPHSWISRNGDAITVVSVTIGIVYTVFRIMDLQSK